MLNYYSEKVLPVDSRLAVYDTLFISPQADQISFILKTKSLPILDVTDIPYLLSLVYLITSETEHYFSPLYLGRNKISDRITISLGLIHYRPAF